MKRPEFTNISMKLQKIESGGNGPDWENWEFFQSIAILTSQAGGLKMKAQKLKTLKDHATSRESSKNITKPQKKKGRTKSLCRFVWRYLKGLISFVSKRYAKKWSDKKFWKHWKIWNTLVQINTFSQITLKLILIWEPPWFCRSTQWNLATCSSKLRSTKIKRKINFFSLCRLFVSLRSWLDVKFSKLEFCLVTCDQMEEKARNSVHTRCEECKWGAFMILARDSIGFSALEIRTFHRVKSSKTRTFGSRGDLWTHLTLASLYLVEHTCTEQRRTW